MQTIGFLELSSIAKGIQAADILLKAADVELVLQSLSARENTVFCLRVKCQR